MNQQISDFRKKLRASGIGPGAEWRKADFHVHLPTSHDYEYKGSDAYEQLGKSLERERIEFAVLLKHESIATKAELSELRQYCPSVTLIPGAEINVFVEALSKKIGKDYYFHCIVAVDPDDADEYGHFLRTARDKLQYRDGAYPTGFKSSILDVANHFREAGALFIPAHLHQSKSPSESRSIDDLYDDETFLGFIREGAFDALEVRQVATAKYFDGHSRTQEGIMIPRISCVCSSDAHHHEKIGRRNTWIKAEQADFGGLKAALALPYRVSLSERPESHARVLGIHISGSFVDDLWLTLNAGLNALIGGKGSGKTAILECLRFVLNTPVPKERLDEVAKHRQHILGSSGLVECLVIDIDGSQKLITRRADSPDRISVTPDSGESFVVSAAAGQVFPISILGWHEIESVADRASARIDILDRAGSPVEILQAYADIGESIAQARDVLPMLQRQARRLDKALKELWELRKKRSTLTRLAQGNLSQLQDGYDWFLTAEERLATLSARTATRIVDAPATIVSGLVSTVGKPPESVVTEGIIEALSELSTALVNSQTAESAATKDIVEKLTSLHSQLTTSSVNITKAFQNFREYVYAPAVSNLSPEDRGILTQQIQVLEETKRLPSVEAACTSQMTELHGLAKQLHGHCKKVCDLRNQVVQTRTSLVTALNMELPGVRLRFMRGANKDGRNRFQGSYPTDGASLIGFIDGYEGQDGYEKLCDLFSKLQLLDIDQSKWKVEDKLYDAKLVDILDVIDDDDVSISLEVGKRGFVEIQSLSAGQRCVAAFPLLLRNSRGPLVVDQPEDNLDNRYIADSISVDLLAKKQSQQYVVTSHNANLVVLTDADLIVHVDSDGAHASVPASGYLAWERSPIKDSVLSVLDGGEAALLARQRKYGVRAG